MLAKADDWSYIYTMSKRELKKDHLLDAGLKVMATRGYNGTSIQDIVNAADVPKGSFYTYFKSKEDFAIEALEKVTEERMIQNRHLLNDRSIPPQERLMWQILAAVRKTSMVAALLATCVRRCRNQVKPFA